MYNNSRKTALVLSGGGSRGAYEAGVWQALTELGKKIDIVTGTSVGAINGAMVVQGDLENTIRLWKEIETHMIFDVPEGTQTLEYAREIVFNRGAGTSGLKKLLEKYIDEDCVRSSPVDFGVVVVELPNFTPHHVFKEDMKAGGIIDYIMASSSIFPAIHSYEIDGREYIDGGYADVMPIQMAVDKGADEIIAVYLNAVGLVDRQALKKTPNLTLIESKWELGSTLVFDTNNARRIMRLGYLDAMKTYGVFDGSRFAFAKSTFDKTTTRMADAAAWVFDMDPCLIYTRDNFLAMLSCIVKDSGTEAEEALHSYRNSPLSILEKGRIFRDLKSIANNHVLTFIIAYSLKEKGADSIFLTRAAVKILGDYVLAARFLIKFNLL